LLPLISPGNPGERSVRRFDRLEFCERVRSAETVASNSENSSIQPENGRSRSPSAWTVPEIGSLRAAISTVRYEMVDRSSAPV
jgi:hypothetical protein